MKVGYDLALSERIEELLGEETFGEILRQIEEDLKTEIFQTTKPEEREQIYHEMHALMRVRIKLQTVIDHLAMERR